MVQQCNRSPQSHSTRSAKHILHPSADHKSEETLFLKNVSTQKRPRKQGIRGRFFGVIAENAFPCRDSFFLCRSKKPSSGQKSIGRNRRRCKRVEHTQTLPNKKGVCTVYCGSTRGPWRIKRTALDGGGKVRIMDGQLYSGFSISEQRLCSVYGEMKRFCYIPRSVRPIRSAQNTNYRIKVTRVRKITREHSPGNSIFSVIREKYYPECNPECDFKITLQQCP